MSLTRNVSGKNVEALLFFILCQISKQMLTRERDHSAHVLISTQVNQSYFCRGEASAICCKKVQ